MILMKAMSSTTTAFLSDNYTADNGSGADDDGEADYTTRRLLVGNENDDNGNGNSRRGVVKDGKTVR
jgi:hypothetical protein